MAPRIRIMFEVEFSCHMLLVYPKGITQKVFQPFDFGSVANVCSDNGSSMVVNFLILESAKSPCLPIQGVAAEHTILSCVLLL